MLDLEVRLDRDGFGVDAAFAKNRGVTAIFGPSGAGKTTLAHLIAGLLRPDSGHIRFDGRTLFDAAETVWIPARLRRIGCVFQDARLFPHLTTGGNLRFGQRMAGNAAPILDWSKALEMFELGPLLGRRVAGLSGGERQRVALARALLAAPKLLILDEPLAALDPSRRRRLVGYLRRLRDNLDLPLIYITHEPREIARFADEAVLMRDGRVLATGPAHAVLSSDAFVAVTGDPDPWTVLTPTLRAQVPPDQSLLELEGFRFLLPRVDLAIGETARLVVRGRDLLLAKGEHGSLSVRNGFPVEIAAMASQDSYCRIELRLGRASLALRLPDAAVREMALAPGQRLHVLIRSVAFEGRNLEPQSLVNGGATQ